MTMGFGVFGLAGAPPPSLPGGSASRSGSAITSARRFESGDHSWLSKRPFISVICSASPPLRSSSQTWSPLAFPGRDDVNDRYLLSGLQRGDDSLSWLEVTWRSFVPSNPANPIRE